MKHVPVPVNIEGRVVDFGNEWLCQKHWGPVPTGLKRQHSAAKRSVKRAGTYDAEKASYLVWRQCKEVATEIAAGLM